MAPACTNIVWQQGCVLRSARQNLLQQKGCVVWITGLSGSGKSTVACALDHALAGMGKLCYVLDGDNVRHGLCKDLGFSVQDREENIRRVGEVAKLFADAGIVTVVSCISPYQRDREFVRGLMRSGEFVEVYMKVPLAICEQRDCKGLYKLARAGIIKGFTGIDDPYEVSLKPEVTLEATDGDGNLVTPECMAETVIAHLVEQGLLSGPSCLQSRIDDLHEVSVKLKVTLEAADGDGKLVTPAGTAETVIAHLVKQELLSGLSYLQSR